MVNQWFSLYSHISHDECEVISQAINLENTQKQHMIPVTTIDLMNNFHQYWWLVARTTSDKLAWFVKISLLDESFKLHEWWSLMVLPEYRWKWLGRTLVHELITQNRDKSLLAVTTEIQVVQACINHPWEQVELLKGSISTKLREIIEWPQSLLDNDRIFINSQLEQRIGKWEFNLKY